MSRVFASWLVAFLALPLSFAVWAAQCTQYAHATWNNASNQASGWFPTKELAMAEVARGYAEQQRASSPGCVHSGGGYTWKAGSNCDLQGSATPLVSSDGVYGWLHVQVGTAQPVAAILDVFGTRTGDYCFDTPSCPSAGTEQWKNFTTGWSRSPNPAGTLVPDLNADGSSNSSGANLYVPSTTATTCIASCKYTFAGAGNVGDQWTSIQPSEQGFYRWSGDYKMVSTGATCQATSAETAVSSSAALPNGPACDGSVGYINNTKTCVARVPSSPPVVPRTGNTLTGNPVAGSAGGGGTGSVSNIPATGAGSPAGGSSASGTGTLIRPDGTTVSLSPSTPATGTKTAVAGEEQLACGAPGQAPCKIDETGTPSTKDLKLDEASITTQHGTGTSKIGGVSDKTWFGSGWTDLFFTPAVATCAPLSFTLPYGSATFASSIDPCPVVDGVRSVMAYIWALAGFWLALSWIKEAI